MDTTFDPVSYLASKGHRGRPASGGRELTFSCFFDCEEPPDSKKKKLYLNVADSVYQCKVCGASGGSWTLQKHFGDEPRAGSTDDAFMRRRILDSATDVGVSALEQNDDVLLYLLNDRGLSAETIVERKIGFIAGGWSLTGSIPEDVTLEQLKSTGLVHRDGPRAGKDFFFRHVLIPIISRGHTIQIRGRAWGESRGGKYMSGPGEPTRVYNSDSLEGAEEVIITEGEFDAMILHQTLRASSEARARRIAVIGLPGTQAIPEEFSDILADAKRIFLGLDSDDAGKRASEQLKERLGTRARILALPYDDGRKCDWTEYLLPKQAGRQWSNDHPYAGHDARDVLRLLSTAAGKRIFSIAEAGAAFRSYRAAHDGLLTGFTQFDQTIKPGLLPGQVVIVLAKTGAGKGHPHGVDIPTPRGLRKFGDLEIGDDVFGVDGAPTTVTGIFERGLLPTYHVSFSDGASVVVDGDHLWQVQERYGKARVWTDRVHSTNELRKLGLRRGKEFRWQIPLAEPAQYPEVDLPIEPYVMGALLGNGSLSGTTAVLTTPDEYVVERCRLSETLRSYPVGEGGCPRYGLATVITRIKALGLNIHSRDKFIPDSYLTASPDQRLSLLQGLMDADGSNRASQSRRQIRFHTTSQDLADGVAELVRSLGGTAKIGWSNPQGDRSSECTVQIMAPRERSFFGSPRKKASPAMAYRTGPRRTIVDIKPLGYQYIRCIQVAAPDHLYQVTRDYIVTHNTVFLCNLAYNMRQHYILFISLEMTREEVYDRLRRIFLFHHPEASDDDVDEGLSRVFVCDENRLGEKDIAALVSEFTIESGVKPEVVFVDYLGYYARGARGNSPYEKSTNAVMQLKADAKAGRFTVVSPHQVNRGAKEGTPIDLDDARDSGAVEETADFLGALYRPDDALSADGLVNNQQPSGKVKFALLKSRHGGKGRVFSLQMDLLTLAVVDDNTPAAGRAMDHNRLAWRGHDWDDLRAIETRPRQMHLEGTP